MSTDLRARMAIMPMWIRMRRKNHCKSMMDQHRISRIQLGPCDVDGNEGEDGENVDADAEEQSSQADDG
jgi:hypothetical protein